MLSPLPAVLATDRPVMPERSVTMQVNGDRGSVGGDLGSTGTVSSPPAAVRTPAVAVSGVRVGTGLWETPQKSLSPARAR